MNSRQAEQPRFVQSDSELRVATILRNSGLRKDSHLWSEYERGKRLIQSLNLGEVDYMRALVVIADYVGV